ncbi:hypothetical protein SLEP1_g31297 [Rubroshorea leprosula]|uniref:Secreted protein n=1 Tax=Rubroshorea leprosula TaxID=152421 RepID=A0AAV5K2Y0_9ROSI|nr:hypothetical protein SLEP1_g31297 [Rubroshorea leprosula]
MPPSSTYILFFLLSPTKVKVPFVRSVDRGSSLLVRELLARDSHARCTYKLGPRVFDREADRCVTKTMIQLLFF